MSGHDGKTNNEVFPEFHAFLSMTLSVRTCDDYRRIVTNWMASKDANGTVIGTKLPIDLTLEDYYNFVNDGQISVRGKDGKPTKSGTRSVVLAALRSYGKFCFGKYGIPNLASLVKVNIRLMTHEQRETVERLPLSDEAMHKLLKLPDLPAFWDAAIRIGIETGLRLSDICQLEAACLGKSESGCDVLNVWTDKRDKRVSVPICATTANLIRSMASTGFLFPEQREQVLDVRRRAGLSTAFTHLLKKAHVWKPHVSFHSIRHAYVTKLVLDGMAMELVAERVGHSSTKTTDGYNHAPRKRHEPLTRVTREEMLKSGMHPAVFDVLYGKE